MENLSLFHVAILHDQKERGVVHPEQVDPIVAAANLTLDKHDIATILRRK